MTLSDPAAVPVPVPSSAQQALHAELHAELHVLETVWRRPTCTRLCAPLVHSLTCEIAHRTH